MNFKSLASLFLLILFFTFLVRADEMPNGCGDKLGLPTVQQLALWNPLERSEYYKKMGLKITSELAVRMLSETGSKTYSSNPILMDTFRFISNELSFDRKRIEVFKDLLLKSNPESERYRYLYNQLLDSILAKFNLDTIREIDQRLRYYPYYYGLEFHWNDGEAFPETSYQAIHRFIGELQLPQNFRVVDIGSGFGRLGFYLAIFRPDVRYVGIELVKERVELAKSAQRRLGLTQPWFLTGNLAYVRLPVADAYYAYFPTNPTTSKTLLAQMKKFAKDKNIQIWVSHDFEGIQEAEGHWLHKSQILHTAFGNITVYESVRRSSHLDHHDSGKD